MVLFLPVSMLMDDYQSKTNIIHSVLSSHFWYRMFRWSVYIYVVKVNYQNYFGSKSRKRREVEVVEAFVELTL